MPKKKNKGGRPPIIDKATIHKLEQAFALGCSDLEACLFADIGKSTFYNYQKKHPEFVDRKETLKENPVLLARNNVLKALQDGDTDTSKWFLERKRKDEFSTKVTNEHEGFVDLKVDRSRKGVVERFLQRAKNED